PTARHPRRWSGAVSSADGLWFVDLLATGDTVMRTDSARVGTSFLLLVLLGILGVWPGAAGAAGQQPLKIDGTPFVYLTDITRGEKGSMASLFDGYNKLRIPLYNSERDSRFQVKDNQGETQLEGKVVHIGARDVVFSVGAKVYAIHFGQSM